MKRNQVEDEPLYEGFFRFYDNPHSFFSQPLPTRSQQHPYP